MPIHGRAGVIGLQEGGGVSLVLIVGGSHIRELLSVVRLGGRRLCSSLYALHLQIVKRRQRRKRRRIQILVG